MSCGNPHDVDCAEILDRVYLYLDGELDEEARQEVVTHLHECGPCLREYGLEEAVTALLRRSCACTPAPEEVRARVIARIQEVRVTYTRVEIVGD